MATIMPDARAEAQEEAQRINSNREAHLEGAMKRVLENSPHFDHATLLKGVEAFHRERMGKIPSAAKYPEARPWVEFVRAVDKNVQELAKLTDREMAIYRSLSIYLSFRGYAAVQPVTVEKCRVAYIPDTDRGALHIKNVDDPIKYWKKRPPFTEFPKAGLRWDGTGSGLHIDDEPEEIFPLPVQRMCFAACNDVPAGLEFLTRYGSFWGRQNVVLFDEKKRSVAIEKCTFNHIGVHHPGPDGRSHISGMVCRDPKSAIGKYQKAKRDQYRQLFNLPEDGTDAAFWNASEVAEKKLAKLLGAPAGKIKAAEVCAMFVKPRTEGGLNKNGNKVHPDQTPLDYTLLTHAFYLDEKHITRWQRDDKDFTWPQEAEEYQF